MLPLASAPIEGVKKLRDENNIPVHAPLCPSSLVYGGDDVKAISVLLETRPGAVQSLLAETPFDFVSDHAWVELFVLDKPFDIERYFGGAVIIPASYKGLVGGYYAFCYLDTDDGLALGREPFGYPKKYLTGDLHRVGRAAVATALRKDAGIAISVCVDEKPGRPLPSVKTYPHLLLQVLPSAESTEILHKRVIIRDTGVVSRLSPVAGEGAFELLDTPQANELAWLEGARPVAGLYSTGEFRSALGKVLDTLVVGAEQNGKQDLVRG